MLCSPSKPGESGRPTAGVAVFVKHYLGLRWPPGGQSSGEVVASRLMHVLVDFSPTVAHFRLTFNDRHFFSEQDTTIIIAKSCQHGRADTHLIKPNGRALNALNTGQEQ